MDNSFYNSGRPNEDLTYEIYGSKYQFEKCHWIPGGWLVGWCKRKRNWAYLWQTYLQFSEEDPVPATLIEGKIC